MNLNNIQHFERKKKKNGKLVKCNFSYLSCHSDYDIPGVLSPSNSSGVNVGGRAARSFGSGIRSGSFQRSSSASNLCIPGTTPPQLFTAGAGYQPNVLVEEH